MSEHIQTVAEQQRDYWNSPVGDKWVNNQATLDLMFVPLTEILLDYAKIETGEKILDVGCGAGTTTRILATAVGANGRVLGVDISTALLAAAQVQTRDNDDNVHFFEGDAGSVALPMQDADLIFSRFGVMFFADPAAAFAHMRKLLKPEGRLCFVCWGAAQDNPWFKISLDVIAARLGPLEPVDPRAPGPMAFAQVGYIEEFLGRAKFDNIIIKTREVQLIRTEEPIKTAEFMIEFGPGARILAAQDVDAQTKEQLINEVAEQVTAFKVKGAVQIPALLHYVRAANT